jgi:hypothetical protein
MFKKLPVDTKQKHYYSTTKARNQMRAAYFMSFAVKSLWRLAQTATLPPGIRKVPDSSMADALAILTTSFVYVGHLGKRRLISQMCRHYLLSPHPPRWKQIIADPLNLIIQNIFHQVASSTQSSDNLYNFHHCPGNSVHLCYLKIPLILLPFVTKKNQVSQQHQTDDGVILYVSTVNLRL